MTGRRPFVDALRGLAVALMVVNHTARWWLDPALGGREALVYVTMVLAGPTFLLLVGFSLALSW
ncbi:MAG: heparan-alpha-glucosaminide N-acetyltransferase domain-containing protein, partial [Candidatus Rokuibacteriota bacterium]